MRCILSKFYIKPQRPPACVHPRAVVSYRNSTSNHNYRGKKRVVVAVVSYRNSTSNHNIALEVFCNALLYLIEILHQTTTDYLEKQIASMLYLIEILHQTTTIDAEPPAIVGCILSKFYIKPQQQRSVLTSSNVVSYRNSTSNHNHGMREKGTKPVVSYRNSTSNHNCSQRLIFCCALYLIEILHQTTTSPGQHVGRPRCILSKFYIKPQLELVTVAVTLRCILSKFYIKPQRWTRTWKR